ncbi:MAG: phosphotransferase [Phycisphaerae bacterium]|nr:phosphotransferase [Phycisphaerae bacterium]
MMSGDRERAQFLADELAIVLSHFDLGTIQEITAFKRGSRKSPKAYIKASRGEFVLKRRAPGRDDPVKVAFCHLLQNHLARKDFPLPHLIPTRRHRNSMVRYHDWTYEMFRYVQGQPYDQSIAETEDAGRTLGLCHAALADYESDYAPPIGGYHDSEMVKNALNHVPTRLQSHESVIGKEAELLATTQWLYEAYEAAAEGVKTAGMDTWPDQVVHGDWHPGNMLYRDQRVVAVIDYDSARVSPWITDLANGILQFSILGGSDDPDSWPDHFDEERAGAFLRGYLQKHEFDPERIDVLPYLMQEVIIAESALPIATVGSFGRIQGFGFLRMVKRKILWLNDHMDEWLATFRLVLSEVDKSPAEEAT